MSESTNGMIDAVILDRIYRTSAGDGLTSEILVVPVVSEDAFVRTTSCKKSFKQHTFLMKLAVDSATGISDEEHLFRPWGGRVDLTCWIIVTSLKAVVA